LRAAYAWSSSGTAPVSYPSAANGRARRAADRPCQQKHLGPWWDGEATRSPPRLTSSDRRCEAAAVGPVFVHSSSISMGKYHASSDHRRQFLEKPQATRATARRAPRARCAALNSRESWRSGGARAGMNSRRVWDLYSSAHGGQIDTRCGER
jgi:hypothetical protein